LFIFSMAAPARPAKLLLATLLASLASALVVYPAPGGGTLASPFYTVAVGPQRLPAFVWFSNRAGMQAVATSAGNSVPAPSQRNISFVSFSMDPNFDTPLSVAITCLGVVVNVEQIYPSRVASSVTLATAGNVVTVSIDQPRQVCLVINSRLDSPLCIFADPLEVNPPTGSSASVIYFGPGTVSAGVINVAAGQTVYLAGGAHVYGRIQLTGTTPATAAAAAAACTAAGVGVTVAGRGVLDGHNFPVDVNGPALVGLPCTKALVDGVTLINSPHTNLDLNAPYTTARWVKAVAWGYGTVGWVGGAQAYLHNSFFRVNDDAVQLYGTGSLAQSVVLWQGENGCAVMGSRGTAAASGFATARTVDVIRHEQTVSGPFAAVCFLHGGAGLVSNYLFNDIQVNVPGWAAVQIVVAPNSATPPTGVPGSVGNVNFVGFSSSVKFGAPQAINLQGYGARSVVANVSFVNVNLASAPLSTADISEGAFVVNVPAPVQGQGAVNDWTQAQKCSLATSFCAGATPAAKPASAAAGRLEARDALVALLAAAAAAALALAG